MKITHPRFAITALTYLFLCGISYASNLPPQEKLCPEGDCRGPLTITLVKKDGSVYEKKWDYMYPVIQSFGMTIFPGEEIRITGEFKDGVLANMRVLEPDDPNPEILHFKFEQSEKKFMMLTVTSKSEHTLKYHCLMMPLNSDKFEETSSCPVLAGKMGAEIWPYPIYQLLISKIFIVEAQGSMKCEY